MRIVLDTNVLVSGLLSPHGPPARIVELVAAGALRLCHDSRIIAEYSEVLAQPRFRFDQELVADLLSQIEADRDLVVAMVLPMVLLDADDMMFVEVAVTGRAGWIVTGNQRHFAAARGLGAQAISPRGLLDRLREERRK